MQCPIWSACALRRGTAVGPDQRNHRSTRHRSQAVMVRRLPIAVTDALMVPPEFVTTARHTAG